MKVIIEHGKTKREINGAFNICGDAKDLRSLCNQILSRLESNDQSFSYGWISIHADYQKSITDTQPIPWDSE